MEKAGAPIRAAAFLIDNLVFGIPLATVNAVAFQSDIKMGQILGAVISTVYFTVCWSNIGGGRTVGARVLGLKVESTDGKTLDLGRAFLRDLGLFVSMIAAFIGVIWIFFDPNKQGWHDKLARSYVVKTR